jgi:hypothetical protein
MFGFSSTGEEHAQIMKKFWDEKKAKGVRE